MADDDVVETRSGSKAAYNEQLKLSATYLNGLALAVMTVGGFSPFVLQLQGKAPSNEQGWFALGCVGLSVIMHLVARVSLQRMID